MWPRAALAASNNCDCVPPPAMLARIAMSSDSPKRGAEHRFGGPWTEVKLDAIADYLRFFTAALKNKPSPSSPFELWYVDAFAGSGDRTETREVGGFLEGRAIETADVTLAGSARRALEVTPAFKHFVFIEEDASRAAALDRLRLKYADRHIVVERGDGNDALCALFGARPWSIQRGGRGLHRGVVFLDPYAMSVRWKTLEILAATGAVDVWYLFPLGAVVRQLARDFKAVDGPKQRSLDEIFGTAEWRTALYEEWVDVDLFSVEETKRTRRASKAQIESYIKKQLERVGD